LNGDGLAIPPLVARFTLGNIDENACATSMAAERVIGLPQTSSPRGDDRITMNLSVMVVALISVVLGRRAHHSGIVILK
jgi:hypothetical protein